MAEGTHRPARGPTGGPEGGHGQGTAAGHRGAVRDWDSAWERYHASVLRRPAGQPAPLRRELRVIYADAHLQEVERGS